MSFKRFQENEIALVFGANMGLFPHLSSVRLWMLRVTMLIRMIY